MTEETPAAGTMCQFTSPDQTRYFPCAQTTPTLPPGTYDFDRESGKLFFRHIPSKSEDLIEFPDTVSKAVVDEIELFWTKEAEFKKYGLAFKRGIMLYGPPGSGKSSTIKIVTSKVIDRGGVVFKLNDPSDYSEGILYFRQIQPETPIVVLMEDLESILDYWDESQVLNILDGVDRVHRVVFLATTNYPEELADRVMNRPSRFDRRFMIPHPSAECRRIYLEHRLKQDAAFLKGSIDVEKWVADTEEMSIAHIKELFISVVILGNKYDDEIEYLRGMMDERPSSDDEQRSNFGFRPKRYRR